MIRRACLTLGNILLVAAGAPVLAETCSPTLFIEAIGYATGASARFVAVADFNGDTKPDVATGNTSPRGVSILLNDGNGGLEAPILTALTDDLTAIAAADFRGNGTADLAVASYNGVFILLGHGDGTFDAPVFYPTDTYNVTALTVGKFDGNSSVDIVVGSRYSSYPISLLPGLGDGTFGEPLLTPDSPPVLSLTSGDFDDDGHLDLVASAGDTGYVRVYPGAGDGTFGAPSSFIGGPSLRGVTTSDFDGDGNLDIAAGSADAVSILLGNGSGGFEAALLYPASIDVGEVAVADFDQDGVLDIVASASTDSYYGGGRLLSVLLGHGDGAFEPGAVYSVGGANSLATADIDGNGRPDVVTAGGQAYVSLDSADGTLLAVPESIIAGPSSSNYARGDWNGDGRLDFAWITNYAVTVVEGLGGGRFRKTGVLAAPEGGYFQPSGVAAGHFFSFDVSDLVVVTYSDVWLYRGKGDGTFQSPVSILTGSNLGFIAAADFDGRQFDDVVVSQGCCGPQVILNLLNHGDGTFEPPVETPLPEDIRSLLPAVMTNSFPPPGSAGTKDLVVATSSNVWVLVGSTGGSFFASAIIPTDNPSSVAVGRFSGFPNDLLVSNGSASVSLYLNDGSGRFPQPPVTVALPSNGGSVTTGDYDGDGKVDFAASSAGDVLVFLGLGAGHFQSPIRLETEISPSYLTTGSFAGSFVDDIAAIGQEGIAAFRNSRLGAFVHWIEVLNGTPAVLDARASGYGPLTYQWRRNGVPLSDGGPISGAQTRTLTIDPVSFDDAGTLVYDVVVGDSCTVASSNLASLSVQFADVPYSSPFHDDIITIATAGITGGCGGSDYCPTAPVRRDQMAAFLLRSEHGSAYVPPVCTGIFSDVPCPSPFADWVEQLSAEGVTSGCGTGIYCPSQSVTRAQMAVFLLKTSEGSAYVPPSATGIFGDVPVGSFAADWIEDLYNKGITGGCSDAPLLYCPGNNVLRQQMATFLVRTFFP